MFCRTCGKELNDQAVVCVGCGIPPKKGKQFCQSCGKETNESAEVCISCGVRLASAGMTLGGSNFSIPKVNGIGSAVSGPKSRLVAGLLAILGVGCFGLHKFYLGDTKNGIIMAAVSTVGLFLAGIPTLAMGAWAVYDAYRIFTGKINEDVLGNPLE